MSSPSVNFLVVSFAHIPAGSLSFSFLFVRVIFDFLVSSVFCLYLMKITSLSLFNSVMSVALEP